MKQQAHNFTVHEDYNAHSGSGKSLLRLSG